MVAFNLVNSSSSARPQNSSTAGLGHEEDSSQDLASHQPSGAQTEWWRPTFTAPSANENPPVQPAVIQTVQQLGGMHFARGSGNGRSWQAPYLEHIGTI